MKYFKALTTLSILLIIGSASAGLRYQASAGLCNQASAGLCPVLTSAGLRPALTSASLRPALSYVDPFIGTGGHGHTFPGASAPFGMVQLSPDTRTNPSDWDGCSGYHYSDSLLYGFSHTHLSGTGVSDYCDLLLMPYNGKAALEPTGYASPFKKENEHAEAGYYSVVLDKNQIKAELTATERTGVHRYTFSGKWDMDHLLIDLRHRDEVLESSLTVINDRELAGVRISTSWAERQYLYFVVRFSKPMLNSKILDMTRNPRLSQGSTASKAIVGLLDFSNDDTPLVVTVGISAVSIEGARQNLKAECNDFNFDKAKEATQAKWAENLNRIQVKGGTEAQLRSFYTALYHTMLAPNLFSDVDGQFRGHDNQIHQAPAGRNVYTVFSLWDTYRAANPLYTLLEPDRVNDFVQSFLYQYQQNGRLPVWELSGNETDCMIGNHSIPVIADAWLKGIRGFDGNLALEAMQKTTSLDRAGMGLYASKGYIPSDMESESVSKTLEYAFDDYAVAQMAQSLGNQALYDTYIQRAQYYKNLYDPASGFFRAKNNGSWYHPFDPYEVNFNYTEANAWQYAFAANQDINGMMQLHGGPDAFAGFLDQIFSAKDEIAGRQQADITGLIGQYVQGNEPSHHIAYLYNYAGQPWKTQQRVHQICQEMYTDQPDGLSGNEDCGQMSAWLVFSAMGFYPAVPVGGQYAIGTPWFEEISITNGTGNAFTIKAPGLNEKNFYVQSAQLNGATWPNTWISHEQINAGGEMVLNMGNKPANWGASPENRPTQGIQASASVPTPYIVKGDRVFPDKQEIQLGCIDASADILYAFTNPNSPLDPEKINWKRYKKPLRIDTSAFIVFKAQKKNASSFIDEAQFSKLQSSLKILRYNTRYDHQYTGRGDNGIIDLLPGGADFRSGGWQGYQGVNLDVVLDQGKARPIHSISANFLQDENSWIFLPSEVRFEGSNDGENFEFIANVKNQIDPLQKGTLQKTFAYSATGQSWRYIRVVGQSLGVCPPGHKGAGGQSWLFVDEIRVE